MTPEQHVEFLGSMPEPHACPIGIADGPGGLRVITDKADVGEFDDFEPFQFCPDCGQKLTADPVRELAALMLRFCECAEVRNWPPGHAMRREIMKRARALNITPAADPAPAPAARGASPRIPSSIGEAVLCASAGPSEKYPHGPWPVPSPADPTCCSTCGIKFDEKNPRRSNGECDSCFEIPF